MSQDCTVVSCMYAVSVCSSRSCTVTTHYVEIASGHCTVVGESVVVDHIRSYRQIHHLSDYGQARFETIGSCNDALCRDGFRGPRCNQSKRSCVIDV